MKKEDIAVTIVLTTRCNMKCKYCINESGNDLKIETSHNEWDSCTEIIDCLKNISKVREIALIKLFGGEPMLCANLICELIARKKEFTNNERLRFAMTTNALLGMDEEIIDFFISNNVIFNLSIDGPEEIHNKYRIAKNGCNSFAAVMKNVEKLKNKGYPFAAVAVLDERIVDNNFSLSGLCNYLRSITPNYKIDPAYFIKRENSTVSGDAQDELLAQLRNLIDDIFKNIRTLSIDKFIFENNILRTIYNVVSNTQKSYVCSAGKHIAIFPNNSAYSCYNLVHEEYKICNDLRTIDANELDSILRKKESLLTIDNFPKEYRDIEFFGDYCAKENNFSSFAYQYRKTMVDSIVENVARIQPGTQEHLALLGYITLGYETMYYKNIPQANLNILD